MLKDNVLYHIFRVYDYKGGELRCTTNLSKEKLLGSVCYIFENAFSDIDGSLEGIEKSKILEILTKYTSDEDFYSTYAGGGGFVGEIYYTENNTMYEIDLSDTLDDMADYIMKNWID